MELSHTGRLAALMTTVVFALVGCGGTQVGPTGGASTGAASATLGKSWMLPEAKSEDLVYIADDRTTVYVYSYPAGKLVGELTGLSAPFYLCSDKDGDVFVPNSIGSDGLYEYAHGGTQPINIFDIPGANSCSVDPTSGNLAVAPFFSPNIYVYPDAQGTPTEYTDSNIYWTSDVAYDDSGDLFLNGELRNGPFFLFELPSGGSGKYETINVPSSVDDSVFEPIQWDGAYLDIGTLYRKGVGYRLHTIVDRLAISGSSATIAGTVKLARQQAATYVQFWIYGDTVMQPSNARKASYLEYFTYPHGKMTKAIKVAGLDDSLWGVTLSLAASRSRIHK
jgi:hypothetical protein